MEEIRRVTYLARTKTNEFAEYISQKTSSQSRREIKAKILVLENKIEKPKAESAGIDRFIEIAKKYTDIQELSPEILRTFIEKIVIHERDKRHSKSAHQQIDIYFTHTGNIV